MKYIFVILAVFAAANTINCQLDSFDRRLLTRQSLEHLIKSKVESICPGTWEQFMTATEDVKKCIDKANTVNATVCMISKEQVRTCFNPLYNLYKTCLPEHSKDIPDLILNSAKKGVDYICRLDAEHVFEIYNPCMKKMAATSMKQSRCSRVMETKMEQFKNEFPSKENICKMLVNAKPCVQSRFSQVCGHPITIETMMGFFDVILEECPTSSSYNLVE